MATVSEVDLWRTRRGQRYFSAQLVHGLLVEVVQSVHSGHDWSERDGDLWVSGIRPMLFAVHRELVNRGMKSLLHLGRGPREFHHRAALGNMSNLEPMRLQPSGYDVNVLIGRAELPPEPFRAEPRVILR